MKRKEKNEIHIIGETLRKIWNLSAILWRISYYIVNIVAFGSSISIILVQQFNHEYKNLVILLSVISALCTCMSFAINFKQHFFSYRKAFYVLNAAMLEYYACPTDEKKNNIVNAITTGEDIINNSYDID